MMNPGKSILALTACFFLLCFATLLFQTSKESVSGKGYELSRETSGTDTLTIQEKLWKVLGKEAPAVSREGRIDINTATAEELDALPGIGEVLAARIVRYRTYNGPFSDPTQICDVTGIGEGLYAGFADLIYAGTT